jgi:hypothetical protein
MSQKVTHGEFMKYKFDGIKLKMGSKTIANVRGSKICKSTGTQAICNIRGDKVCEGTGTKAVFNLRGDKICEKTGARKICSLDDVNDYIEGPGGLIKAAMWFFFIR